MIFLICFVKYSINDVVLSSSSFLWKMTRTATAGTSQAYRPSSQSGRPMSGVALLYITTTTTIIITIIITIQYSGEQARQRGRQARYHGGRFENAKNCQNCKTGLGHIWKVISGIIKFQTFSRETANKLHIVSLKLLSSSNSVTIDNIIVWSWL